MPKFSAVVCCAVVLGLASIAYSQTSTVRLTEPVTDTPSGGTIGVASLSFSADGNTVVFTSGQDNLVPGDTNRSGSVRGIDVFVRDIRANATRRLLGVGGAEPNGDATTAALTRDGRLIFFLSTASNLVASDPNGAFLSAFRHDLTTASTTLLDIPASLLRISGDGRYVGYLFNTLRFLDLQTGITSNFLDGAAAGVDFQMNLDGSVIAFTSSVVTGLYSGITNQIFVRDRATNTFELISRRPDGSAGNGASYSGIAISDDGRYVAFESAASDLVPDDTNGVVDVFLHDRVTRQTTRVSLTAGGGQRALDSGSPAISPDGSVVAFASTVPGICADCFKRSEIAVYDRPRSLVDIVSVSSDGTPATDPGGYFFALIALDQSGRLVAFGSNANLTLDPIPSPHLYLRDRGASVGCSYAVSPTPLDVGAAGGTATFTLTTGSSCLWSAHVTDAWVSASSISSTGPTTISLSIAANTGVGRFGFVAVEGRRILIRQPGALASGPPQAELIDRGPGGSLFPHPTYARAISGDGRYVAFASPVRILSSGASVMRVYLRDRATGQTIDVSSAPGGPPTVGDVSHDTMGIHSADYTVSIVTGYALSEDGRFVHFGNFPPGGASECFLFDRETATTSRVPTSIGFGAGAGSCPSMNASGRYFVGVLPNSRTLVLYDRATGLQSSFSIPGVLATDLIRRATTSLNARYVLVQVDTGCSFGACSSAYSVVLDRVTGTTSRTPTENNFFRIPLRRFQLVDPLWAEFRQPRFHTRLDETLLGCEMVNRQTGQRLPLPLLKTFTASVLDCGVAVNQGRQVLFASIVDLSPGDMVYGLNDLHVYTLASGSATRLASHTDGRAYPLVAHAVSQDGRFVLGSTSTSYFASNAGFNAVVFDLGIVSTDTVDGTAPSNLQATVSGTTVAMTWTAPTQGTPTSYVVEAGNAPATSNIVVLDTGTTATTLTAVAPPGTYYIRVRARSGGTTGSPSNEIAVSVPGACSIPLVPSGLTHTVSGVSVTLAWQAATGASQYVIDAGSSAGQSNLVSVATGSTATTFGATARPGTYYVRVRARNACGTSSPSNETIVVVGGGCPLPSAPTSLSATVSGASVALSWTAASGSPTGYVLDAGSSSGASNLAHVEIGASPTLSATAPPGTYFVRVRARNACGVGPVSNEAVVTVH